MLLILSKIFLYAKKTHYTAGNLLRLQGYPTRVGREDVIYRNNLDYRFFRRNNLNDGNTFTIDGTIDYPLLNQVNTLRLGGRIYTDRPPAYSEVVENSTGEISYEPPPPYTSREVLNNEEGVRDGI